MYTMSVKYTDFNDVEKTKTVYFNLSKAELAKLTFSEGGSLPVRLQRMVDEKDNGGIFDTITWLIDKAYGVKSDEGEYFVKSEKELEKFKSSPVYDEVLIKLLNDETEAGKFVVQIMPKDVRGEIEKAISKQAINGGETMITNA